MPWWWKVLWEDLPKCDTEVGLETENPIKRRTARFRFSLDRETITRGHLCSPGMSRVHEGQGYRSSTGFSPCHFLAEVVLYAHWGHTGRGSMHW